MKEPFKITALRKLLESVKKENEKMMIGRDEARDIELRLNYYELGVEFEKNRNKELNDLELDE